MRLTYLKEMTEKEELIQINTTMKHCVRAVERIETLLVGDKFNEEGLIQQVQKINKEVQDIKTYQMQQRGGISVGKWLLGTSIGAYLLLQFENIQQVIKNIFK